MILAGITHKGNEMDAICQRCQKLWKGDALFVTCDECRTPPPTKGHRRKKEGCTRFKTGTSGGRSSGQREDTRETKFGLDR